MDGKRFLDLGLSFLGPVEEGLFESFWTIIVALVFPGRKTGSVWIYLFTKFCSRNGKDKLASHPSYNAQMNLYLRYCIYLPTPSKNLLRVQL